MGRGTIEVVCAWCYAFLGEKDGHGVEGVSLSLCPDCIAEFRNARLNGSNAKLKKARQEPASTAIPHTGTPVVRNSTTNAMQGALFALSQRQHRQARAPLASLSSGAR